jgi:hypothetical protein
LLSCRKRGADGDNRTLVDDDDDNGGIAKQSKKARTVRPGPEKTTKKSIFLSSFSPSLSLPSPLPSLSFSHITFSLSFFVHSRPTVLAAAAVPTVAVNASKM